MTATYGRCPVCGTRHQTTPPPNTTLVAHQRHVPGVQADTACPGSGAAPAADTPADTTPPVPTGHSYPRGCANQCGRWIVVNDDIEHHDSARTCNTCAGTPTGSSTVPDPDIITYPPSAQDAYAIQLPDPNTTAHCMNGHGPSMATVQPMTARPDDITLAYAIHDWVTHNPGAWLVGGAGGASDDICNHCGGARWDKDTNQVVRMEQPRHDMCLRGKTRGRGGNCPCTHDKPHMRGIRPDNIDQPGAVQRLREDLAARRADLAANPPPEPPAKPTIITNYLFDPEEDGDA